jgi:hypothetical protein
MWPNFSVNLVEVHPDFGFTSEPKLRQGFSEFGVAVQEDIPYEWTLLLPISEEKDESRLLSNF